MIMVLAAITASAETVNTTAGKLSTVVTNHEITSLSINGTIDARDFLFIATTLNKLTTLNLSNVNIAAYASNENDGLLLGIYNHEANTLPYGACLGMKHLVNVVLPSSLKAIDYAAFAGCTSIKNITFPASLTSIGNDAFNTCNALTKVTIGGNINHLGDNAFARCSNLATLVINPNVTLSIGNEAFMGCSKLSNVTLGARVDSIGDRAFAKCTALNALNIMEGSLLAHIGDMAFYESSLKEFDFSKTPRLHHLGAWAMARTKLTSLSLPAHVKALDEGTFFYNTRLTSLSLPKTLNYLPDYMLAGCDHLSATAFMTQEMGSVGDYALYNQSQHTTITVPFSTYYLGKQAMAGMTGLKTIVSKALEVPELGDDVWAGIDQSKVQLNVNENSVEAYSNAAQWKEFFIDVAQLRGDINSDGFVNTDDATGEQRFIVNGDSQGININLTDVNGDGEVDVADITSIYNIINGTEPLNKPERKDCNDHLCGEGKALDANNAQLEIKINNSINFTAFQMSITTPTNISLTAVNAAPRCVGHEIHTSTTGKTTTVVAFSPAGDDIEGYEGTIIILDLTKTSKFDNHDQITLNSNIFVDYEENAYNIHNTTLNVLGISAVDNIQVDDSDKPVNVYNLQGQLLRMQVERSSATQGLPAGIYIVGGKKVIVR